MEQLKNPFVIYGYKGAEYFCDRKKKRPKRNKEHEQVHTASGEDCGRTSRYIFPSDIKKSLVILFQLPAYRFIRIADRK